MNDLNHTLAEWAGFKYAYPEGKGHPASATFIAPEGGAYYLPNFTSSLDACFKWLVPKLHSWTIGTCPDGDICAVVVLKKDVHSEAIAETPALALCKAIEKLIDEGTDG